MRQVMLLGTRWATARSPAMMVKISGRPVTGRAIDWHWFFDWEAEESEKKFCVALPTMPSMVVHGLMVESESVEQSDAVDEAP